MNNNLTCIICPLGCKLNVERKKDNIKIKGQMCNKGEEYAIQEIKDPRRILTTTVWIKGGNKYLLPVRSRKKIPKNLIKKSIIKLSKIKVKAPIKCGEIIFKNILETKVDIIATCDIDKIEK
jgi:CxxC motif-containing protein